MRGGRRGRRRVGMPTSVPSASTPAAASGLGEARRGSSADLHRPATRGCCGIAGNRPCAQLERAAAAGISDEEEVGGARRTPPAAPAWPPRRRRSARWRAAVAATCARASRGRGGRGGARQRGRRGSACTPPASITGPTDRPRRPPRRADGERGGDGGRAARVARGAGAPGTRSRRRAGGQPPPPDPRAARERRRIRLGLWRRAWPVGRAAGPGQPAARQRGFGPGFDYELGRRTVRRRPRDLDRPLQEHGRAASKPSTPAGRGRLRGRSSPPRRRCPATARRPPARDGPAGRARLGPLRGRRRAWASGARRQ